MYKKFVIAVLIIAICGSLAFAAGGTQQSGAKPTLIWWLIGNPGQYLPQGLDVISNYIESRVGARLEIKAAGWGDAGTRLPTIINSGEYYDIMFTDGGRYTHDVALGAYMDITDMVGTVTPQLRSFIPSGLWDGIRVNGRVYAVPTYKDSSLTDFQVWDEAMVKKYNINTSKAMTFAELDRVFRQMKAGEGARFYPMVLSQGALFSNAVFNNEYDSFTTGLPPIGVAMFDANKRVVSVFEQPVIMDRLRILHQWYIDGIVNPDAPVIQETPPYRPFFVAQGWPAMTIGQAMSAGVDKYIPVQANEPFFSTDTIQGSLNAISRNSKYATEALKFLEMANTDHKLRDMLAFGMEGINFEYVKPNVVREITVGQWGLAAYQQATFFQMSTREGEPEDTWNQVRSQNEKAVSSVLSGFVFDPTAVQNELANCKTVYERYVKELMTGASDPDVAVPAMIRDLNTAGFQRIMQEAQRQVNAFRR